MPHGRVHPKFDPSDSLHPRPQSFRPADLVLLVRSSFDRIFSGYTEAASQDPRWEKAHRDLHHLMLEENARIAAGSGARPSKKLLEVFDGMWFRGMLAGKVVLSHKELRNGHLLARTRPMNGDGQVIIEFDLDLAMKALRRHHTEEKMPPPTKKDAQAHLNGILVHEMTHALFYVYCCQCPDCQKECGLVVGKKGHGLAWAKVMKAIERSAKREKLPVYDYITAKQQYLAEAIESGVWGY
ncbi:MAG: hypothetical protein M1824_003280 [Vezdaea acicularis]|nr:MAG: hypothetical protein M1824_003280 [Vezdaea acicularis]